MEIETETAIALIIILLLGIEISYAIYTTFIKIPSKVKIKTINLNAYQDSQCTIPLSSIEWGILEPDSNTTYNFYLLNNGNDNATLTMKTENWQPSDAPTFINLIWDAEGKILIPNEPLQITLTLQISKDISGITEFSFDIIIYAN